jgi:hypothetical protein
VTHPRLASADDHDRVARRLKIEQTAWLSRTLLAGRTAALRACVTSYETQPEDMDLLVHSIVAGGLLDTS